MRFSTNAMLAGAALTLAAAWATPARATVALKLSDNDATPTAVSVAAGQTFTVTASLISTGEQVTGVDYYLSTPTSIAGKFRIKDRNNAGSSFSDLIKADAGDNAANPGVEDTNYSLISVRPGNAAPRNGLDLGASIANVGSPLSAGQYILAAYTITVASDTPAGTYTLSTTADAGTGWVGTAPFFNEAAFAAQGSFSVTVTQVVTPAPIPEPGVLSLVGVAAMGLARRRRR
ncbi:MAG TPA: PEP-CTERM sorting domain-containing protein [Tepidisphaeraceae bacterium]|nr:PEP-CTERM sorting domain-containing protein [Tepidisphaeraceae bacterium]